MVRANPRKTSTQCKDIFWRLIRFTQKQAKVALKNSLFLSFSFIFYGKEGK